MSVAISFWRVTHRVPDHHLGHIAMTFCHPLPMVHANKYKITIQIFGRTIIQTSVSWVCVVSIAFAVAMRKLKSERGITVKRHSSRIVFSFKLQQACESWHCFILDCPCTTKHLYLRHTEAYTEGRVRASPTLNISFKHMPPGWLVGCRTSSKATGKLMHEIAEKTPWQQFKISIQPVPIKQKN